MNQWEMLSRLIVAVLLLAGTIAYLVAARSFQPLAAYVPLLAGGGAAIALGLIVIREVFRLVRYAAGHRAERTQTVEGDADIALSSAAALASLKYIAYMLILLAGVWKLGLLVAGPVFVAVFLWLDSKMSPRFAVTAAVVTFASFYVLREFLGFALP